METLEAGRRAGRAGDAWAALAALSYALQNLLLRLAPDVPAVPAAWIMLVPSTTVALAAVLVRRERRAQLLSGSLGRRVAAVLAVAGVAVGLLGNTAWVRAMEAGGAGVTVPATQSMTIWAALFAHLALGERVTRPVLGSMAVFVTGVLLLGYGRALVSGILPSWPLALPLGLLAGATWGLLTVSIRYARLRGADRFVSMLGTSGVAMVCLGALMLLGGEVRALARPGAGVLWLAGAANVAAQLSLNTALGLAPASRVAIISSTSTVLAPLLSHLITGEPVNLPMLAGMALVLASVAVLQAARGVDAPLRSR